MAGIEKVEFADGLSIGGHSELLLIAGPCVIESKEHVMKMADMLKGLTIDLGIKYVFKASYDKANRSSVTNFRGPGIDKGLDILAEVRERFDLPILTDFHSEAEVEKVAEVVDILQVPAFLSRQTDILVTAGKSGKVVNIKKGQFMAPWDMKNAVDKVASSGNSKVCITERVHRLDIITL